MEAVELLEKLAREEPELCDVKYETKWIPIGPWEYGAGSVTLEEAYASPDLTQQNPLHYAIGSTPEETGQKVHLGTLMRQNMKVLFNLYIFYKSHVTMYR